VYIYIALSTALRQVLMYGGYVKEAPYFLGEFWSALLPAERDFRRPVSLLCIHISIHIYIDVYVNIFR
jgi:hypothetical protein